MKTSLNMGHDTTIGTVSGTALALVAIPTQTILATIICAVIGATTSFLVTMGLKTLWAKLKNRNNANRNGE